MKKALLIIDVQNDYFFNGKCELSQPDRALEKIEKLLEYYRKENRLIIFVQHLSTIDGDFFVPETLGAQIHKNITPLVNEKVIIKHYPNSFFKTTLQNELIKAKATDLVVCGMMTHMCVDTTVRAAKDYGYNVTLILDACATKGLVWDGTNISAKIVQQVYMASLNNKFAAVLTSDEYYINERLA